MKEKCQKKIHHDFDFFEKIEFQEKSEKKRNMRLSYKRNLVFKKGHILTVNY
jgi:hypothetical protein